ncbi:hypothetical protein [Asticcacaulis sp. AC466]|uniref:hypothetical protein n=1 Tax=Asticcacaulis sp. AC466 TaxID=1282362 RepID=UPI000425175A|nr:hypothetical protein [Asticcacaulis sp. AC466]
MRNGVIVLSVFAAIWAFMGLHIAGQPLWAQFAPLVASFMLILLAVTAGRNVPAPSPEERKRVGRTVMIWSAIEGVAIFGGINVLVNMGHAEWEVAFIALIVGLHFFPLAIGLRAPLYWLTGLGLIGAAAAGVALMPFGPAQDTAISLGCAAVLYVTAVIVTARMRQKEIAANG